MTPPAYFRGDSRVLRLRALGVLFFLAYALAVWSQDTPRLAQITAVKSQPSNGHLRLVISLSGKVEYRADRARNPDRILFDLVGTQTAPGLNGAAMAVNLGPVQRVRVASHDLTTTRVVIDAAQEVPYTANFAMNPPRLEIDLVVAEAKDSSPAAVIPRTTPAATVATAKAPGVVNTSEASTKAQAPAVSPTTTRIVSSRPPDAKTAATPKTTHTSQPHAVASQTKVPPPAEKPEAAPAAAAQPPKQQVATLNQLSAPEQQNIRIASFGRLESKPADAAAAAASYRKLAETGNVNSQYRLANAYAEGSGVPQDYAEAAKWYRKAAEQGHVVAENDLGVMYANGWGVPRSEPDAWKWLLTSASHGYAGAQNNVGAMYLNGHNDAEAARWIQKAAAAGVPEAQYSLGTLYANGRGVRHDDSAAIQWFRKAAEQSFPSAQLALGKMYLAEGPTRNYEQALTWLRQAAEAGVPEACYQVAQVYLNGWGVHADDAEGASWMRKAAESGVIEAQVRLAEMLRDGRGIGRDAISAYAWFAVAGASGNENAKTELKTLSTQMSPQQIADAQRLSLIMVSNQRRPQGPGVDTVQK